MDILKHMIDAHAKRASDEATLMALMGRAFGNDTLINEATAQERRVARVMESLAPLFSTSDSTEAAFTEVADKVKADDYEVKTEEVAPSNVHLTVTKDGIVLVISLGIFPRRPGVSAIIVSATKAGEDVKSNVYSSLLDFFEEKGETDPFEKADEILTDKARPPLEVASSITTIMQCL